MGCHFYLKKILRIFLLWHQNIIFIIILSGTDEYRRNDLGGICMRNRIVFLALAASLLAIAGGCKGETSNENINPTGTLENIKVEEIETVSKGQSFIRELDFEYVEGTDSQCNEGEYVKTAYAPTGTYTLEDAMITGFYGNSIPNTMLFFTDDATGIKIPLCIKGNCTHDDKYCDANFDVDSEYKNRSTVHYYDDNLYVVKTLEDYYALERISPDGSTREIICNIMRRYVEIEYNDDGTVTMDDGTTSNIVIHRGYVYYSTYEPGATTSSLNRVKIEKDAEIETIYTLEGDGGQTAWLYRVKPYGRYVFFQMGLEQDGVLDISIYAFDTEELDIFEVIPDQMRDFIIVDNHIIYEDSNEDFHVMNLETGEERSEFNTGITTRIDKFFNVGDLIVFQWTEEVVNEEYGNKKTETIVHQDVYSLDGELVNKLSDKEDELYEPY